MDNFKLKLGVKREKVNIEHDKDQSTLFAEKSESKSSMLLNILLRNLFNISSFSMLVFIVYSPFVVTDITNP